MPTKPQHLEMVVWVFLVIGALIACQPGTPVPLAHREKLN
jgi:hypothetical protein